MPVHAQSFLLFLKEKKKNSFMERGVLGEWDILKSAGYKKTGKL